MRATILRHCSTRLDNRSQNCLSCFHHFRPNCFSYHSTNNERNSTGILLGQNATIPPLLQPFKPILPRYYTTSAAAAQTSQVSVKLLFPDFPIIHGIENLMIGIHSVTGLPWWTTIISSAFLLRTLLPLPLTVYTMHNSIRLQRLQPEIKETATQLRKEVSMAVKQFAWTQKKAKEEYIKNLKRHLQRLYQRDNCHPMKDTASFWLRLPIWVSASYAMRNMSIRANSPQVENHDHCSSMTSEGLAWFTDLTTVDSTWILPITMGLVTLMNVEISRRHVTEMTTYRTVLTFALRGLSLAFIPISSYLPAGLVLYWISSGVLSAMQTVFVDRSKMFQKLIGISQAITGTEKKSKSGRHQS